MFFGGALGQRLEPVGAVRHTVPDCPLLNASGHLVGYGRAQRFAVVNAVNQGVKCLNVKVFVHFLAVKNQLAKILRRASFRNLNVNRFLTESILNNIKS